MIERPILFSGEVVRAILDGRKTQTRRVVSKNNSQCGSMPFSVLDLSKAISTVSFGDQPILKAPVIEDNGTLHRVWPRWEVGNRLWVRETWMTDGLMELYPDVQSAFYKADGKTYHSPATGEDRKWRPSIHMPRWASRITLEITNVRVERLQDITEEDAIKEGIQKSDSEGLRHWPYLGADHLVKGTPKVFPFARQAFSSLWDSINGKKYPWASNPWVWVVEFNRVNA